MKGTFKRLVLIGTIVSLVLSFIFTGAMLSAEETPIKRVDRISGSNRYGTAIAISQKGWQNSSYVVLARGDEFADALAGVPLAYSLNAPILLTRPDRLQSETLNEIKDLGAENIILLGGTGAISLAVETELRGSGLGVSRIAGSNRYETASKIALQLFGDGGYNGGVMIASGQDFPDALAASAYAARLGYPIILSQKDRLPSASESALGTLAPETTYVIGGQGAISDQVVNGISRYLRISGSNRYGTAAALAKEFKPTNIRYYFATGADFADAIAGGVLAANEDAGLLLLSNKVPPAVVEYIANYTVRLGTIFGGYAAVSLDVEEELEILLASAALTQAIADAQEAIDALPDQVAGAEDADEAQGYIDEVQELIDAVLDLDPDYDTTEWDAVIAEQQAIVDALRAVEAAEAAAQALAGDGTDSQEAINAATGLYEDALALVNALPDGQVKDELLDRLEAVKALIDAAQVALEEAEELAEAIVNAQEAIDALPDQVAGAEDADEAQGYIDEVQELIDAVLDLDPDYDTAEWDAVIAEQQAIVDALRAVEAAEAAAQALTGDGTDSQEAIDAATGLYEDALALVNALPDGQVKDELLDRLEAVKALIDAAQVALDRLNEAEAAVVVVEVAVAGLKVDGTDSREEIDGVQALLNQALALVNDLPAGAAKVDLEERLASAQAIIDTARSLLDPVTVTIQELPLPAPVTGQAPVTFFENEEYSGVVTWTPDHKPFQGLTLYKATVVLTAKPGYTFEGVPYRWFRASGTGIAHNEANSGVITVTYGYTNFSN